MGVGVGSGVAGAVDQCGDERVFVVQLTETIDDDEGWKQGLFGGLAKDDGGSLLVAENLGGGVRMAKNAGAKKRMFATGIVERTAIAPHF